MGAITFPIYDSIFPGESVPTIEQVLGECSSERLFRAAAFLNSKIHKRQDDLGAQEEIFKNWISAFDISMQTKVFKNYARFKFEILQSGGAVVLFNSVALLRLMESIVFNYNAVESNTANRQLEEISLFKAWLISNQFFRFEVTQDAEPTLDNLFKAIVVNKAIQYEFLRPKYFHFQILLGSAFFRYFEQSVELKIYYDRFFEKKGIAGYKEYLGTLTEVYMDEFSGKFFGFKLNAENIVFREFYDSMAVDYLNLDELAEARLLCGSPDFRLFREKPLVKMKDGSYYLIHYNFFVDKPYQGLVFDFYNQSGISAKYKSVPKFLQFLGQDFAEKELFYKFLPGCFPEKYAIKVPGDAYKDVEYSDYYVRVGQSLFLFEFKNVIMGVAAKHSKSFSTIRAAIVDKLVISNDGQSKGITQLFNTIKRLIAAPFHFDDFAAKKVGKLQIFPVLVYTDDFFDIEGVQTIISEEFGELLAKIQPATCKHKIHDVTLVHLHDIINISCEAGNLRGLFRDRLITNINNRRKRLRKKDRNALDFFSKHVSERLSSGVEIGSEGSRRLENLLKEALGFKTNALNDSE